MSPSFDNYLRTWRGNGGTTSGAISLSLSYAAKRLAEVAIGYLNDESK